MKKEAYQVYKIGDKERAYTLVESFITKHPKEYKAQNLLAVLYYWSGKNNEAKEILTNIVSNTNLQEAEVLLARIKEKSSVKSSKKISYKDVRDENKKSKLTDLEVLVSKVQDNPQDVENRVALSKFYFKIEEFQKAYDMAHEVLLLEPNNQKMKVIINHLEQSFKLSYSGKLSENSAVDKVQAKVLLKKLHDEKKYHAYYNLYKALKDNNVVFSKKEYVDILHASIMIGKYKEAQALISNDLLPKSAKVSTIQLLLAKKLSNQVASR